MSVVDGSFDNPMKPEEEASASLAGGIMNHGYQCGMLWGASLAAGAEAYRRLGSSPHAETAAIMAAQRLVESFKARTKNEINCFEITEMNFQENTKLMPIIKFLVKGGNIGAGACFRLIARYTPEAFSAIESALSEEHIQAPALPVSCAAILAHKMGVSDMHRVMAAGFSGGIGLSGGGCGALGAAIWIIGMNGRKEGIDNSVINSRIEATIDRFMESSGYEFECSKIIGRRFENISDHADYLRDGGCLEIIESLTTR